MEQLNFKPNWKFPEQNELPGDERKVFCIDSKNQPQIGYHRKDAAFYKFIDNSNRYFYCIAWCECPAFL